MKLTSLEEDFRAIGMPGTPAPSRRGASDLTLMESQLAARFGSSSKGTLARMRALSEGRTPPAAGRTPTGTRSTPRATRGGRVNVQAVQESVRAFHTHVAKAGQGSTALRTVTEGSARVRNLVQEVNNLVSEIHQFDRQEAVRAWANVAVISELLARRTERMGRAIHENALTGVSATMRALSGKATKITEALKEGRQVPNLGPRFNQAMRYVVSGTGLLARLTEGPDAPFPAAAPRPMGAPAAPPDPNAMGMEGDDPLAMGAPMPTQGGPGMGMEADDPMGAPPMGAPPMGGAPDPNDPLGMGPTAHEAMSDDDRVPYNRGAERPELDQDDPLEEGDDDPENPEEPEEDPLGMTS